MGHDRELDRDAPPPRPVYGRAERDPETDDPWLPPAELAPPRSLADDLELGRLRNELRAATGARSRRVPERIAPFRFTGDGSEYFRIWVVNLLLTLVTLGIYSAWAKVRKTRYFWQNTRLDGHAFDYHGDPRAILLGRVVALALVLGYAFAFDISRTTGLVMLALLCAVGPWLFMRAQRFRLVNSSWRGLRFGFDAQLRQAYRVVLPPLLIWFSSAIIGAVASTRMGLLGAAGTLSFVMIPWMHHRLKAYQHSRACYGARTFAFLPATPAFYAVYFKAGLMTLAASMIGGVLIMFGAFALRDTLAAQPSQTLLFVAGGAVGLVGYLVAWPYFAARLQAAVWSHTRLGDVRFSTAIAAGPLFRLTLKNVLLTLATAGLYWPFAAVALARYRVECMRVESDEPLTTLAELTIAAPGLAAGDAAAEAFGLDIGL
jgi:uncharacterized membrane protein YjgN (DUF898 family)